MVRLTRVSLTFMTYGDDKNSSTVLHVFVKNRKSDSSTPEGQIDFISNKLAWEAHELLYQQDGQVEINPYLAFAQNLAAGHQFPTGSSATFDIPLRSCPIQIEEIELPVVNVHILAKEDIVSRNDRWIFSYDATFYFDDGRTFTATSVGNGITGIILDQDNRNHSGILLENPLIPRAPRVAPSIPAATLQKVEIVFYTHNDDKDNDTQLNIHLVNRLSATQSTDIAVATNLLSGQKFDDPSSRTVSFGQGGLALSSTSISLASIVLPQLFINIGPNGNDRWIFDYKISFTFSNGQVFSSTTSGVILDQDNHKYGGVYQGRPFPSGVLPAAPPLTLRDHRTLTKTLSLKALEAKLDEFINSRQVGSGLPPLRKIFLHNSGEFGVVPESYYDLQSIDAAPPRPGTVVPASFLEDVRWDSAPASLGQLTSAENAVNFYFNNIRSRGLTVKVNPISRAAPEFSTLFTIVVDFDPSGSFNTFGAANSVIQSINVKRFTVTIHATLDFDKASQRVDLLGWVSSSHADNYLQIDLEFANDAENAALAWKFKSTISGKILDKLTSASKLGDPSVRDSINMAASSWLCGGDFTDSNTTKVETVSVNGDQVTLTYTGTPDRFWWPTPQGWPPQGVFTPGKLANIEHVIVLMLENRSFDHMLGYLSLPATAGGMERADVDGLKGTEFNLLGGQRCPAFAFSAGDTIFSPDPPHSHDPVRNAINGGAMDGFAKSYAKDRGPSIGPRIMGHHTAVNVPVFDALTRDFAICHRWFASHPGPTFPNRFFTLTGRPNIDREGFWELDDSSPLQPVFTDTIFDFLGSDVSWKYFEQGYCFLRFFQKYTFDSTNIVEFADPISGFAAQARAGTLPAVSFIDPHFIELPPGANADGPPSDIQKGQALVKGIVEALVASPLWPKSMLIVTYDEHGGFYDHVPPPAGTKVSPESLDSTVGVRVPAMIISPWIKAGMCFGHDGTSSGAGSGAVTPPGTPLHFDHTTIAKTIAKRFLSARPPYMGPRYAAANDLESLILDAPRQPAFLPFIPYIWTYGPSNFNLQVQGGSSAAATPLQQAAAAATTDAQQFSLEDAGNGLWYVRTHCGNLYLTADDAGNVKQDVRYASPATSAALDPNRQLWKIVNPSASALSPGFVVWSAAFAGKVMQPSGTAAGAPIVLVTHPTGGVMPIGTPGPWKISSPLLATPGLLHN